MSLICRSVAFSLSSLPCFFHQRIDGHPLLAVHPHRGIADSPVTDTSNLAEERQQTIPDNTSTQTTCTFCKHGGTRDENSLRRGIAQHTSFQGRRAQVQPFFANVFVDG